MTAAVELYRYASRQLDDASRVHRITVNANIANPHPAAPEGRLIAGESGVSRIDIETMVFRVPRTDPIATAVAPWLVHHPGYSVNAERETVFREEPTPDRGDPINAIQDAPDGTHRDKSIADLKGV